jgi:geranylgeranylglycerol-phosphate geranylgeranyltransferase
MTPQKSRYEFALLQIMRPINSLMMGLAVIVGEVAIAGRIPPPVQIILGFLVSFFLTASSMVVNDIIDVEIDRINAPKRPLPSGRVSIRAAKAFGVALAALGIIAAALLSGYALIIASASLGVSVIYNVYGKRLGFPGNLMVGFTIAVPFLFGGIVVTGSINFTVATFFSLAFLATVGREVAKGIADVIGDEVKGIKTVARVYGCRSAAVLAAAFFITPVLISPIPFLFGGLGLGYLLIVLVVDAGFVFSSAYILVRHSKEAALKVKGQARVWMLLALIAFFVGGLLR